MKKPTIILSLLLVIGLLAACGSNSNQTPDINEANSASQQESSSNTIQDVTAPSTDDPTKDGPPEGFEFEVNLQTSLIVGSFDLEGTENEITTEQAAELLPLWMVLKNLLESDTSAMVEINALTNQIADTMTDSQMSQINGMEISPESMRAMMQEMGLNEDPRAAAGGDGEETSGRGVTARRNGSWHESWWWQGPEARVSLPNRWSPCKLPARLVVAGRSNGKYDGKHSPD